jgi:GT2 family glycosyltransferase
MVGFTTEEYARVPTTLSVIIVNYNTREDLRACLESLRDTTPIPEIIVVDNGSTDGSAAMVDSEFPGVILLAPGRNTWFCGGNNLGIAAAHGRYVLLLNPDTVVPPDALPTMLAFCEAQAQYAGVTAQLRYPDGTIQRTCSRIPTYVYLLVNHTPLGWLMRGQRDRLNAEHWYADWQRDTNRDVDVVPGSCLLARREGLRLNDRMLLYFPEDDLARRVGAGKFHFLANVQVTHREKSATRNWLATQVYFRDLIVYTRTHHGRLRAALLWLLSRPVYWGMWTKRKAADFDAEAQRRREE